MARSLTTTVVCAAMLGLLALVATIPAEAAGTWNQGANGTVALASSFFDKIFAGAIPVIDAVGPSITIGPLKGDHYSIGTFKLNTLAISAVDIALQDPNSLILTLVDVNVSVPTTNFSVFVHVFDGEKIAGIQVPTSDFKLSCDGTISGGTSNMQVTAPIVLTTNASNGKVWATIGTPSLSIGALHFDTELKGFCKIAGGIIDLFKSAVTDLVKDEVNRLMPAKIQRKLQEIMGEVLPKVPLHFASQPKVEQDTMELNVEIIPPFLPQAGGSKALPVGPTMVTPHIFTDRDVSIGISTQSFNDVVAAAAQMNLFHFSHEFSGKYNTSLFALIIPKVFLKCMYCPFAIDFSIQPDSPPTVVFGGEALEFSFTNAVMNFTAFDGEQEENLFSVYANLSFGLTNFTVENAGNATLIKFDLALNQFALTLGHSFLGPIGVAKLGKFVQGTIKDLIVPLFNSGFDGLPISLDKDGFGLESWKVDLHQDAITLGANLLLPGTAGIAGALLRGKL